MNIEQSVEQGRRLIPGLHDLVKLDGRWAQVQSAPNESVVIYLDDGSTARVVWSEYDLVRHADSHVRLQEMQGERFTDDELRNIRWGSEQDEHPDLVREVHVFGEFTSRKEP